MNALVKIALVCLLGSLQPIAPVQAGRPGPRDFHLGLKQPGSVLARQLIVDSSNATHIATIFTASSITYVEALDQTNGTGGYVGFYRGGVRETHMELHFRRLAEATAEIWFVVNVWTYASEYERVAEFQRGTLTETSLLERVAHYHYPGWENGVTGSIGITLEGDESKRFTYVESFDLSDDQNGGFISTLDQVGNSSSFSFRLRPVVSHWPMNLTLTLYTEERENAGRNFRLGRYVPGIERLQTVELHVDAIEGEIVTGHQTIERNNSTIVLVQARDHVPNGTSRLVDVVSGGIGSDRMTLVIESGVGEPLNFTITVQGIVHEQ